MNANTSRRVAPSSPARDVEFTAIDFETTGTVPGWPVEPWQIGLCAMSVEGGVRDVFSSYLHIDEGRPFNIYAPGRHATMRDTLAASPTLPDTWPMIADAILSRPIVAHNAGTERTMLRKAAPLHSPGPWIDTLRLSRIVFPSLASYALEDVVRHLGLSGQVEDIFGGTTYHDAAFDAVCCAAVLRHLLSLPGWEGVTIGDLARASTGRAANP